MKNSGKKQWNKPRSKFQNKHGNKGGGKDKPSGPFSTALIDFYKSILVPEQMTEEEFTKMLELYRRPLCQVFRLSQLAPDHDRLEKELNTLFHELQVKSSTISNKSDESQSSSPVNYDCIEYKYFPSKYGRVFKVAEKNQIRKLPEFEKFNTWLRFNTDVGNCHRQEFVSMIPPLFMDIKPNSAVLDTCAAPGSKTAQIMEMLSSESNPISIPDLGENERKYGFVVANDSNSSRCHDLVHQIQRIGTHNVIVTCQNGTKCEFGFDQFDRVLCDVVCTGDGTMRKDSNIGPNWTIFKALNLHETQRNILIRGLELLRKDGICVYSTCSMNPIEDEAIVSEVVTFLGSENVEIVDCSQIYPEIKRHPGLKKWTQINAAYINAKRANANRNHPDSNLEGEAQEESIKAETNEKENEKVINNEENEKVINNEENDKFELPIEENEIVQKGIHTEAKCEGIEHCMRFYPQDHDSGGFFVCVLHKKGDFERKTEPKPAKEIKEKPYSSLLEVSPKDLDEIFSIYKIHKLGENSNESGESIAVNPNQFFIRDDKKVNKVYYMSQPITDLINKYGSQALKTISAGTHVFSFKTYSKNSPLVPYVSQEGIKIAFRMINNRKYALLPSEMKLLLESKNDGLKISAFEKERQKIFDNMPRNAAVFYIENTRFMYTGHLAKFSINLYLKKELRDSELRQLIAQFPDLIDDDKEEKT